MTASAKMVRMVAAARQFYGGRQLRINDEFDATETDAADLECLRFAIRKRVPGVYNTEHLTPITDAVAVDGAKATSNVPKNKLSRRDLRARK